jgi:hypothetical protein
MKMKEKKPRKSAAENLRFFGLKKIRKFVHPHSILPVIEGEIWILKKPPSHNLQFHDYLYLI